MLRLDAERWSHCRHPLAWAAHGLALWDVLTTPEAPSSLAARLRVTEVWSCVDIPAGTAGRLLCPSGTCWEVVGLGAVAHGVSNCGA